MKILGIIPARSGSKGISNKNMKVLGDKPLIAYTIESALNSKLLTKVFVSSENKKTIDYCESNFNLEIEFSRPEKYSQDNTPMFDVIKHAVDTFNRLGESFDAVCLLQPTVPFRADKEIDNSIKMFLDTDCDTMLSSREVPNKYNPNWLLKKDENDLFSFNNESNEPTSNRQSLNKYYYRDGSIYLFLVSNLKNNSIYGKEIRSYINSYSRYVNLDELEDWKKAEKLLKI